MKNNVQWYGIRLKSNFEFKALEILQQKEYEVFLPTYKKKSIRRDRKKILTRPLFSGYIFVHCKMSHEKKIDIFKTSGFYSFLGTDPQKPAPIPDAEINKIKTLIGSGLPLHCNNGLVAGDALKVLEGPLAGIVGKYIAEDEKKGKFHVNIEFMNRSIEVELEQYMFEKV
ncbi:MAG: hypothetical protein HQK84_00565 [Nitrospinae bacterium]|nr:hypothetical protein [Nitrospinota bacterium]